MDKHSFPERFEELVLAKVGEGKRYKSYRALTDEAGCHNSNVSNFISGRTQKPEFPILAKLSIALELPRDYLMKLWLYCTEESDFDPEVMERVKIPFLNARKSNNISLFIFEFLKEVYKTDSVELIQEKIIKDINQYHEEDIGSLENHEAEVLILIQAVSNIQALHEIDMQSVYIIADCIGSQQSFDPFLFSMTFEKLFHENILGIMKGKAQASAEQIELQAQYSYEEMQDKTSDPFRYPEDHYERRPVLKATGGAIKQYIDDQQVGESDRMEWGYMKGMPNAFFV